MVKRLEDAGASAIIMHSLFEEQISGQRFASIYQMEIYADGYPQTLGYFPKPSEYALGPDEYLDQVRRVRQTVSVPVIGSLNGTTPGGWTRYAKLIQDAGADALELNIYEVTSDAHQSAQDAEARLIELVTSVVETVSIPVAVKLCPFFTSLAEFACKLEDAGADGLVLFNRFYQPDIDIEMADETTAPRLSDSGDKGELLLRLRWASILGRQVGVSLAISGGVHTARDAIKSIMAGADAVQLVSALLRHGPEYLLTIRQKMERWMEQNRYASIRQMRGTMGTDRSPDPNAQERGSYVKALQGLRKPS
jgi:dihydroorotate dehydrogenase (fumarate)